MFKIIRLLISLAVIVAVVLIIKKSNGRKKWLTIIAGVLVFAIGSALMSELPPEKFLRKFSLPQEVFNYSQQVHKNTFRFGAISPEFPELFLR